jgi:DNA-binding MarR family transcriptional regulator
VRTPVSGSPHAGDERPSLGDGRSFIGDVPASEGLSPPGDVPTPEDLSQATRRLDLALTGLNAALARRLHVSQPELMAMAHVRLGGSIGPSELAHRLDITTGAVTALVDRLAERGHLERHPHPADRRKLLLTATPQAREEIMRHVTPLSDEIKTLATSFNDEERTVIGRYLAALTEIVERHARQDTPGDDAHQTR